MPFDDFDRNFDKTFKRMSGLFVFWFIFCAALSVGFLVFLFWLAYEILQRV